MNTKSKINKPSQPGSKSILVTGGAGFIGSHLCDKLISLKQNVYCLDNFCDFYDPQIKKNNISKYLNISDNSHNFILLKGDIRDTLFLEDIFSRYSFDTIIHLAAMAGVRPSIQNPRLYYDVNITGTYNLLEAAVKQQTLPDFIFASSSSVYGNNEKIPFCEDDSVDNPISPYAVTKKAGELICYNFHHLFQLPIICLRFFTVYGPRQRPDLAIHKFASMILNDEPIPFFGDGMSERDYTYIDDIIQGVIKAIDYIKPGVFEIFNLGESKTITLSQMVAALEKHLDKKAQIKRLPIQQGDVQRTFASLDKSREKLGYNPKVDFDKGIKLFIDWLLHRNK